MPQTETKYRLYNVNCSDWRGLHLPPLLWALSLTHFKVWGFLWHLFIRRLFFGICRNFCDNLRGEQ